MRATAFLWFLCALEAGLSAQTLPPPLEGATVNPVMRRLVRRFDFEERKSGNFTDMPRHWSAVHAPEFPRYNSAGFDNLVARSLGFSLRVQSLGQNAAAELAPGAVAAIPGTDYVIRFHVRTTPLDQARTRLIARYIDRDGRPLEGAAVATPPLVSADRWSDHELVLPTAPIRAAWISLRVELVQPAWLNPEPDPVLGANRFRKQDLEAVCWYDDIDVYRVPRIVLKTQFPSNLIRQPHKPRLTIDIQDPLDRELEVLVTVVNHRSEIVATDRRRIDRDHPRPWSWDPDLPRQGWYQAQLSIFNTDGQVASSSTRFAWLSPWSEDLWTEAHRFVLAPDESASGDWPLIEPLLEQTGPQTVLMPALTRQTVLADLKPIDPREPDPISHLILSGRRITLGLSQVPEAQLLGEENESIIEWMRRGPDAWQPYLQPLLGRYGHHIQSWMLGSLDRPRDLQHPDLLQVTSELRQFLRRYIADPTLILPWPEDAPLPEGLPATQFLVPVALQRSQPLESRWPPEAPVGFVLRPNPSLPVETHSGDLARTMLELWNSPGRLTLWKPWRRGPGEAGLLPEPLLAVWVEMAQRLSGRRFTAQLDLGPGRHLKLLEGAGSSLLVGWCDPQSPDLAVEIELGENPRLIDLWGNRSAVSSIGNGMQRLDLSPAPLFVEDADVNQFKLLSSFRITPTFLSATQTLHERRVTLKNPWPVQLTGTLRLKGPESWKIQPSVIDLSIAPEGEVTLPVQLTFPLNEPAGLKTIRADLRFETDRPRVLHLQAPLTLGLENMQMAGEVFLDGEDVVVKVSLNRLKTDAGSAPISFYLMAYAGADLAPQQRLISTLSAGDGAVKYFRYRGAAGRLAGKPIRISLKQIDGPAQLNDLLQVPGDR